MAVYKYDGPVYKDGRKIESRVVEVTHARSFAEARRNFQYKIGIDKDILYNCIEEVITNYVKPEKTNLCDNCGNMLFDNGRCPYCDDDGYAILDDIRLLSYLEED